MDITLADTLPQWLAQRFGGHPRALWDEMSPDEQSRWEHEAAVVRREVESAGPASWIRSMPERIQRTRAARWFAPLDEHGRPAIYVGRPTVYANPFRVIPDGRLWIVHADRRQGVPSGAVGQFACKMQARRVATTAFETHLRKPHSARKAEQFARELRGRDLACWCELPEPGEPDWCHAAILLRLANADVTAHES